MEEREVIYDDEQAMAEVPEEIDELPPVTTVKQNNKKRKAKRKNTLAGSTTAKVIAFILWVLAGVIGTASVIGIIIAFDLGVYTKDFKSVLETGLTGQAYQITDQVQYLYQKYGEQAALDYLSETNAQVAVLRQTDRYVKNDSVFIWQSYEKTVPTGFYSQLYMDVYYCDFTGWKENAGSDPAATFTKDELMYRVFVDPSFPKNDSLKMYYMGLQMLYQYRIPLVAIAGVCIFLFLFLFVFLLRAAGHKNGEEGIVPGVLTAIPFDLLTVVICIMALIYLGVGYEFASGSEGELIVGGSFCLIFGMVGMVWLMDYAIRLKLGKVYRNTLVYKLLHFIWTVVRSFLTNLHGNILICVAAFAVYGLVEGIVFLITVEEASAGALFWILAKMIEFAIFMYIVIMAKRLLEAGKELAAGKENHRVDTTKMFGSLKTHGEDLNNIGKGITTAVEERMKSEHMKTELISNVSHDIKTPLTSIINYADLISHERTDNATIAEYAEVIGRQSQRLKKLLEDLVEASKVTTGNLEVNLVPCEVTVLLSQAVGEYMQRLEEKGLDLRATAPAEDVRVMADGRHLWRVFDNLLNNICKYAQENTRVFLTLEKKDDKAVITFRNMSKYLLELSPEELEERFVRGDKSRHKEGSGLGLSIAKNLTELQNGTFDIILDGDLFKVVLTFPSID